MTIDESTPEEERELQRLESIKQHCSNAICCGYCAESKGLEEARKALDAAYYEVERLEKLQAKE